MGMTVEERLGRIDEKLDQLAQALPEIGNDVEHLKEFKWKVIGAIGVIVPIYTIIITFIVSILT